MIKRHTAILISVFALLGCRYPEVDEGGFPPGVDGGVDAAVAVADSGTDTGVDSNVWAPLPSPVDWCSSASYSLPCTCVDDVALAFTACDFQVMNIRANPERIAMANCIDTARGDGAGCGRPYCEDVRYCYEQNEAAMTPDDEIAIAAAYGCIDQQLRATCAEAP